MAADSLLSLVLSPVLNTTSRLRVYQFHHEHIAPNLAVLGCFPIGLASAGAPTFGAAGI
jgi:hypothetical protein